MQTAKGARTVRHFYRTKPFDVWILKLEDGKTLKCADTHLVYASVNYTDEWLRVQDLTTDHYIYTYDGWSQVKEIIHTDDVQYMADV